MEKTSLRTGFGISRERNFGNITFNVIRPPSLWGVAGFQRSGHQ
jgi:hypothetical protein